MRTRVLLVCLTSVPLLAWAPSVLADRFTEKVATAFRKNAPDLKLAIREDNELQVEGSTGPLTLYLDNIRASCASDPPNCDAELESFVKRAAFVARSNKGGRAFVPEKVFVVLRSAGFGKRAGEQFASDEKKQPVVRPFVTGIELLYVIDTPKAFRFVNRADLDVAGLNVEQLHEIAIRNVRALRPPEYGPAPNPPDIFFMPADDGLGTSRVLDSTLWDRIEKAVGGAVVVCAPTRDWILFVRRENRDAIERLRDLAKRIVRGEAYPVSPVLFYRQNGSWQAYAG